MKNKWMGKYLALLLACFPVSLPAEEPDCEKAMTTLDINYCAGLEQEAAEQEMQRYLEKSLERHSDDAELVAAIKQAQEAWQEDEDGPYDERERKPPDSYRDWWYHSDHLGSSTYLTDNFGRPSHYYETL